MPPSPLLYTIAIEPLLQKIATNPGIATTVLPTGPPAVPVFGYADDVTVIVPDAT